MPAAFSRRALMASGWPRRWLSIFVFSTQGRQANLLATQLDFEFVARLEVEHRRVGLAHHQVAVELHLGAEAQLAAALTNFGGSAAELNTLGIEKGFVKSREIQTLSAVLLGGDIAAGTNDV